jgi:hypothetical protein
MTARACCAGLSVATSINWSRVNGLQRIESAPTLLEHDPIGLNRIMLSFG